MDAYATIIWVWGHSLTRMSTCCGRLSLTAWFWRSTYQSSRQIFRSRTLYGESNKATRWGWSYFYCSLESVWRIISLLNHSYYARSLISWLMQMGGFAKPHFWEYSWANVSSQSCRCIIMVHSIAWMGGHFNGGQFWCCEWSFSNPTTTKNILQVGFLHQDAQGFAQWYDVCQSLGGTSILTQL